MRIAIATLSGLVLAVLLVSGLVQSASSAKSPVTKSLYNYGSR